eukprot:CAMPEP_0174982688 /NCGR_PEP_ID=MMETSP0004_2-20121128/16665_1 /TAXON_ID=420556 /ORGANISM="Ochromonas sp., Strain CCMP1393" /LENGTH=173 /DNA_ID=CAMNT_0016234733 /DNA_START=32 /DNA_END=550 /DNA_ORIENTATION=+
MNFSSPLQTIYTLLGGSTSSRGAPNSEQPPSPALPEVPEPPEKNCEKCGKGDHYTSECMQGSSNDLPGAVKATKKRKAKQPSSVPKRRRGQQAVETPEQAEPDDVEDANGCEMDETAPVEQNRALLDEDEDDEPPDNAAVNNTANEASPLTWTNFGVADLPSGSTRSGGSPKD